MYTGLKELKSASSDMTICFYADHKMLKAAKVGVIERLLHHLVKFGRYHLVFDL